MKKTLTLTAVLLLSLAFYGYSQELRTIKGSITDGNAPLNDVLVLVRGGASSTFTDEEGKYEIQAETGDMLEYRYAGMKTYKVPVQDVTRFLNLIMVPDIQELQEVTVTSSRRKSQQQLAMEYRFNPKLINTYFGVIDAERAYGRVQMLSEDDINPIGLCILDVIRNRFTGVRTLGTCATGGSVVFRGVGSIGNPRVAIFDVDGQIFRDAPTWLDVTLIKRMALISSVAYTTRYGAIGSGGVIVINTVNGYQGDPTIKDLARLRNNYLEGPVLDENDLQAAQPEYLIALQNSNNQQEARVIFDQYQSRYSASPYFYLDAYRYFYDQEGGRGFADDILRSRKELFTENAVLLKALAFIYQEQGRYKETLELFKDIFILRPHYSQSYMDLAVAYRDADKPARAAGIYARYKYLVDIGYLLETEAFAKVVQHESDNLLQLEADAVGADASKIATDLFVQESTRMVFEWNDSEAEFELQFVNPEGQYYTWKHTFADNEERILEEKETGYSVLEYVLDDSLPGAWNININYLGNKSITPTYLKATIYDNYGTPNQRKRVKTFKLRLKSKNQQLMSLVKAGNSQIR
ncbi:MAG: carboxypeptidase-like regulatory domain-containing protein [Eudoraea sp.]|nr:carboxypeptidase-like regulatory domain-containing protein [Eudoraea sp.]